MEKKEISFANCVIESALNMTVRAVHKQAGLARLDAQLKVAFQSELSVQGHWHKLSVCTACTVRVINRPIDHLTIS